MGELKVNASDKEPVRLPEVATTPKPRAFVPVVDLHKIRYSETQMEASALVIPKRPKALTWISIPAIVMVVLPVAGAFGGPRLDKEGTSYDKISVTVPA